MKTALTRLLRIAALASLVVGCAPFVASLHWIPELFTHFRVQLIAGQVIVLAGLLSVGARRLGLLLAICALVNVVSIREFLVPSMATAQAAGSGSVLRLMSVNVLANNVESARLLETIDNESPDLVLVLEYTPAWAERLAALGGAYPHRVELPKHGTFGIALFSKRPLAASRELSLAGASALDVSITLDGTGLRIVGVHLEPPTSRQRAAKRNEQLDLLAAAIAGTGGHAVVLGDFNLTPYSPHFASFRDRTGLTSVLAGRGPAMTWPTRLPLLGIPIDHCFVSESLTVSSYRRLPRFGSDHYPILVDLRLRDFQ